VSTAFVSAPQPFLSLPRLGCDVTLTSNGSCPQIIASPTATPYQLTVFTWGNSSPGTLALSDNCGGTFGTSQRSSDAVIGFWLPPVAGGLCILTAQAVNDDGLSSTVSAAVVTRPGTVATAQPPQIGVSIDGGCFVAAPGAPADCGDIQIGSTRSLFGSVGWQDGFPGSVTITDDCVGRRPDPEFTSSFFASWIVASSPGTTCTLTVHATSLEGSSSDAVARYHVVAAPTR
jgi:hypothetical protein